MKDKVEDKSSLKMVWKKKPPPRKRLPVKNEESISLPTAVEHIQLDLEMAASSSRGPSSPTFPFSDQQSHKENAIHSSAFIETDSLPAMVKEEFDDVSIEANFEPGAVVYRFDEEDGENEGQLKDDYEEAINQPSTSQHEGRVGGRMGCFMTDEEDGEKRGVFDPRWMGEERTMGRDDPVVSCPALDAMLAAINPQDIMHVPRVIDTPIGVAEPRSEGVRRLNTCISFHEMHSVMSLFRTPEWLQVALPDLRPDTARGGAMSPEPEIIAAMTEVVEEEEMEENVFSEGEGEEEMEDYVADDTEKDPIFRVDYKSIAAPPARRPSTRRKRIVGMSKREERVSISSREMNVTHTLTSDRPHLPSSSTPTSSKRADLHPTIVSPVLKRVRPQAEVLPIRRAMATEENKKEVETITLSDDSDDDIQEIFTPSATNMNAIPVKKIPVARVRATARVAPPHKQPRLDTPPWEDIGVRPTTFDGRATAVDEHGVEYEVLSAEERELLSLLLLQIDGKGSGNLQVDLANPAWMEDLHDNIRIYLQNVSNRVSKLVIRQRQALLRLRHQEERRNHAKIRLENARRDHRMLRDERDTILGAEGRRAIKRVGYMIHGGESSMSATGTGLVHGGHPPIRVVSVTSHKNA